MLWLVFFVVQALAASYQNPIIPGFNPDPSCTRVEERFFCVSSSFSAFPGIPVYTSTDLVQWEQIGNVLTRSTQLPDFVHVNDTSGGMWAPTIRYHNGTYYVSTTLVFSNRDPTDSSRWENLIFNATNPFGDNWSDPVFFEFNGYDPTLFWDDDGRSYIVGSHYWRIYPAIQAYEIDPTTGKNLTPDGGNVTLWSGTGGEAPEGPHLYKKDGFYYLLIAEGGTAFYAVTMARKPATGGPLGSYAEDPCPYNPVLTNANTTEYFQGVAHADIFNDAQGNWWAVSIGTRNATVNFPMGRETGLVPAVWEEGQWPVFAGSKPGRMEVNMTGPLPSPAPPFSPPDGGNLVGQPQKLTFSPGSTLPHQFVYYHYPNGSQYAISPDGHPNTLALRGCSANLTQPDFSAEVPETQSIVAFVGRRQDHVLFTAESTIEFIPETDGEEAGMSVFLTRAKYFAFGVVGLSNGTSKVDRYIRILTVTARSSNGGATDPVSKPGIFPLPDTSTTLRLRVEAISNSNFTFSYGSLENGTDPSDVTWVTVGSGDATEVSGGFTGTLVGMYATGNGKPSTSLAYFSDFEYIPVQGIF